ncbi:MULTISPECIES: hypothetical protein [Curtobacterium]|uniref:hypothetical protein n=1 Tax=Curtobacterium TaxID=2034 RepID=UPI0015F65EDE|nr:MULTISPECIES: hypothetical protein [Curtobacterium]MCS6562389.1 hypothetical protein [Curtobacterium flaccumfaciens pv. poinsettiae]UXN28453.1 hypothetical protein N8D75_15865 [Curtobacterium flaccumfaciens]
MTVVRPPRWELVLTTSTLWILSAIGAATAAAGIVHGDVLLVVVGSVCAVPGGWAAVRAPRVGVRLAADQLRYEGWLVGWTAPRQAITVVLDDGSVEWRDGRGVEQRRHMAMLAQAWEDDGTKFAPYWRWRREGLLQVRQWAGARAV